MSITHCLHCKRIFDKDKEGWYLSETVYDGTYCDSCWINEGYGEENAQKELIRIKESKDVDSNL